MSSNQLFMMLSISIYLISMVAIGVYFAKKNNDVGDFYLGGRTLGPIVTAMSAEASDMSSWLLMGLPGLAYLTGLSGPLWTGLGLAFGTYINWLLVAKRIRVYSHNIGAITIPEFFGKRYHDKNKILDLMAAVIIIIFFIPYTASGFAACGKLFHSLFGVSYIGAMLVSAAVIVGYTTLGGFLAASTTDLIQSIVMTIAMVTILGYGFYMAGGIENVFDNAKTMTGYLSLTHSYNPSGNSSTEYGFLDILSTLAWGLGYFGMPHILLRFMAIGDKNKLKTSRRVATVWVFISLGVAILIGIVGNAVTKAGHLIQLHGADSETIIVKISHMLSTHGIIPALIAGVIMAGILAATMSTSDSQLLAASSSVSQNVFKDFLKLNISDKTQMLLARVTVLAIALLGILIASNPDSSVFEIVSFAWAGFGATFGPVMLAALFWKRSNKYGAVAGMLIGAVAIFLWKYLIKPMGGIWGIYELLPAFIIALIAIVIVSLCTKEPDKSVQNEYEKYKLGIKQ